MEGYIGQVIAYAGWRIPRYWLPCEGETLDIQRYTALYSLIGTVYGGDGVVNFKLPDLRDRVLTGVSKENPTGTTGGAQSAEVHINPAVLHSNSSRYEIKKHFADGGDFPYIVEQVSLEAPAISTKVDTIPPFLSMRYIICYEGIYPDFE
jgi:microcystin-dependent protein